MNNSFIAQVYKGKNSVGRYVAALFVIFIFWQLLGIIPLFAIASGYAPDPDAFMESMQSNFMGLGIPKSLYLAGLLFTFVFAFIGLYIAVTQIHGRSLKTVMTSRDKFDWTRVKFGFALWGVVLLIMTIADLLIRPEDFVLIFDWQKFLVLAAVAIVLIPIQTTFEEVLFRGYFMQAIGGLTKNRWMPLILTSVIFGLVHGANPEIDKLGPLAFVFYIGTGFLFGIMTLMDEGMELSVGFHAVNNLFAALMITTDWTVFQTDAVFMDVSEPSISWQAFIPVFIVYPVILYFIGRRLSWTDWKAKLFGPI
jgi:hypothetical protein